MPRKTALVVLALVVVIAYFTLDAQRWLSLDGLREGLSGLAARRAASPWTFTFVFGAIYVAVTAVSLPGALPLTLAAGALFGLVPGTIIVSIASTVGATVAFLLARSVLRDGIERRFGERLATIDAGLAREGAWYLFALRLVPVIPFFAVNLLMGLTRMPVRTFAWVSQLGMLGGTIVYVNAGTELARLSSAADVLSLRLLVAFALVGVLPLAFRAFVKAMRRRRVYRRWQRPASFERDLVVIGAGAAGLVTSFIAATVRAKVTLVEARRMGGDCLNTGCVPSKALIRAAKVAHQLRTAERFGVRAGSLRVDFRAVMARVREVVRRIEPHDSVERYRSLGVDVRIGHARLVDPWTVEITDADGVVTRLTARSIVIAAGARPFVPPLPGLDDVGFLTSDTLWEDLSGRDAPPDVIAVLGGGPIGCELAQALARLGSRVTLVEMAPRLLAREDEDVAALALQALEANGVEVLAGHKALRCEMDGDRKVLVAASAGAERRIAADAILVAVGRAARLEGYGLEELGIPVQRTVTTNEYLETLYPNIFAAGDVAGPYQFTHAAGHQAWYAAVNALFGSLWRFKVDHRVLPAVTFLDPEIARVGISGQEAVASRVAHEVVRFEFEELDRAVTDGATRGFVKVVLAAGSDRILGVTIVGAHAGELIAEFALAMRHGLGLGKVLATVHAYPTFAESSRFVAGRWRAAHAPQRLLWLSERYLAWRRG